MASRRTPQLISSSFITDDTTSLLLKLISSSIDSFTGIATAYNTDGYYTINVMNYIKYVTGMHAIAS